MIDLDKIEQQCKGAIENGCGHLPALGCGNAVKLMEVISRLRYAEAETGAILSMLRQAEKDAERYRWLRDEAADADQTSPLVSMADEYADIVTDGDYQGIMFGKLLDAAIDEAMQCK